MQRCTFLNYVIKKFKSWITGRYQLQMQVASTGKKKKKPLTEMKRVLRHTGPAVLRSSVMAKYISFVSDIFSHK